MTDGWQPPSRGALDDTPWPETLIARATDSSDATDDRLFGYAVLGDVAANYGFSDAVYLSIVGELPTPEQGRIFALAMTAAAPVPVLEASAHTAVLARLSGSTIPSTLGASMLVVGDRTRVMLEANEAFLRWLDAPNGPPPVAVPTSPWVEALFAAARLELPTTLPRDAALLALFHTAGVRTREQLEAALMIARITGVAAEALQTGPQHLPLYPVKVPEFRYEGGTGEVCDSMPTGGVTDLRK
ncbi:MAG: hypothetical protein QM831_08805 [Kofleriaceae bacterium]